MAVAGWAGAWAGAAAAWVEHDTAPLQVPLAEVADVKSSRDPR